MTNPREFYLQDFLERLHFFSNVDFILVLKVRKTASEWRLFLFFEAFNIFDSYCQTS